MMHSVTFSRMSAGCKRHHYLLPAVNVEHDELNLKTNVEEKWETGTSVF